MASARRSVNHRPQRPASPSTNFQHTGRLPPGRAAQPGCPGHPVSRDGLPRPADADGTRRQDHRRTGRAAGRPDGLCGRL
jgi:hypothetical protein